MGSRSLDKAKTAIENLKKECPESNNTVEALQLDLTSDDSIEKAFKHVEKTQGLLDVLINNAGVYSWIEQHTHETGPDSSQEPHLTWNSLVARSPFAKRSTRLTMST